MTMTTMELMQVALDLVGMDEIPDDSAIYVPGLSIQRVLFALDVGAGELLLGRHFDYDAVIAHHPVGVPFKAWRLFALHANLLMDAGVPEEAARAAVVPKLRALQVDGITRNYEQAPMVAQRLGMPFLNVHRPLDELGRRVMQARVDRALEANPEATLGEVAAALALLPEARRAATEVQVLLGDPDAPAGKVVVAHGAYTNGGYHVARAYYEHGIDTVVYIHVSPGDLARLAEHDEGQLIVTGHVVGDAFGITPYIKELRQRGITVDVLSSIFNPE